jgi:hypothetical protein
VLILNTWSQNFKVDPVGPTSHSLMMIKHQWSVQIWILYLCL